MMIVFTLMPESSKPTLEQIRHTLAHLLAHAVQDQFPSAKFAIGPSIETGFYYDIDIGRNLTPEDLKPLEKRMKHLIKQRLEMRDVAADSIPVRSYLEQQPFKQELLREIQDRHEPVTFFQIGTFVDLCRGGHVPHAGHIDPDAFTLSHVAGAYWRGDSTKPMLQRIYGLAFSTKAELNEHLAMQAEAAKRDHRKIGKELGIFSMHGTSPGTPFWLPNGMIMIRELEDLLRQEYRRRGFQEVRTPVLAKKELWEQSGHWQNYRQNMFTLKVDTEEYALKAMNCPESTFIYREHIRSYRDLPLRLAEFGVLHRNEVAGALGGLFRVRGFVMDDAHIYVRPDQIRKEISDQLQFTMSMHKIFGLKPSFVLATRPNRAIGDPKLWDLAEQSLAKALKSNKIPYTEAAKDGAFYGPKIDINVTDSIGRPRTIATIQLDFFMPESFNLEYTDDKGVSQRPVMIHRAIFGSFERFIGLLIEHYAGAFPLWLSPVQVQIIPVTSKHNPIGKKLLQMLFDTNIRVTLDDANETVGYKIRKAEKMKVPYMIVVGDKEKSLASLSIRVRGKPDTVKIATKKFLAQLAADIAARKAVPQ